MRGKRKRWVLVRNNKLGFKCVPGEPGSLGTSQKALESGSRLAEGWRSPETIGHEHASGRHACLTSDWGSSDRSGAQLQPTNNQRTTDMHLTCMEAYHTPPELDGVG